MIKFYDDILDPKEITLLCSIFLNENCPYYLKIGQTDLDDRLHFTHCLQDRDAFAITSQKYYDVINIIIKLCKTIKIKLNKVLRASVNLTFPYSPSVGAIHIDHPFDYKQFIICLTDGGATHFFNKKNKVIKKIVSKKSRVLLFDKQPHAVVHSEKKERVIIVVTFI